jgi:hypothetical protein
VVACGRNVQTPGSDGTIINGVTTAWAPGGRGNWELGINRGHAEYSHWQLCKLYVWDHHLPDEVFAKVSMRLMNYLAGASKEAGDRDATDEPDKVCISIKKRPKIMMRAGRRRRRPSSNCCASKSRLT